MKELFLSEGFRPMPFWSWNDRLDEAELKRQLDEMKRAGYGGCFIHSRVGRVTEYCSEEWFSLVRACAEYGASLGLEIWLYDEDLWPSGFAGGAVPALSPRYREKNLALLPVSELKEEDDVFTTLSYCGQPYAIAVRTAEMGDPRFCGACYIDPFCADAVDAFLSVTHERYAAHMGDLFGSAIKGIFTDEPSFGMYHAGEFFLPYGENFEARFYEKKGYDFRPRAGELFFDEGDFRALRYDYYDVCSQLFCEVFFGRYAAWCRSHRLLLAGHVMGEDSLASQAYWLGAAMPVYEWMDIPGVDRIFRSVNGTVALKQASSAAEQLGKSRVLCECFAGIGQERSFADRKRIMDDSALCGIDFVNPHLSLYSMRGERKRDYPPNFFYQQPYFPAERLFSDYAARLSAALSYGRPRVRVLVLHPIGSYWSEYSPVNGKRARLEERLDRPFAALTEALSAANIGFHFGDERLLARHAACKGGRIVFGDYSYDTVVLPFMTTISADTERLLRGFTGNLFYCGCRPTRTNGAELRPRLRDGVLFSDAAALVQALCAAGESVCAAEGVRAVCREGDAGTLYFYANRHPTERKRLTLPDGEGFVYHLSDGSLFRLPETKRSAELAPFGSLALWFGKTEGLRVSPMPSATSDGAWFTRRITHSVLPETVRAEGENLLPLKRCDFFVQERLVAENLPMAGIWHDFFYPLADGTPFSVRYRFEVRSVPAKADLLVENAENLDAICLNGVPLTPLRGRGDPQRYGATCGFDLALTRVPSGGALRQGENVLELRGIKRNRIAGIGMHRNAPSTPYETEAEVCYLAGAFGVFTEDGERFFVDDAKPFSCGEDVCRNGYPYFAGRLIASYDPKLAERGFTGYLYGNACACAVVSADGMPVAGAANAPWYVSVPAQKVRRLEIVYYNTLFNAVGPTELADYDQLPAVTPQTFCDRALFRAKPSFKPFRTGILEIEEKD